MSSTENNAAEVIGDLFDEVIDPVAARRRSAGAQAFPLAPDPSAATYYMPRTKTAMTREDFTAASCDSYEELERCLTATWQANGRADLIAAVPRFVAAARAAYALGDDDVEVSPFVYVMF